MSDLPLDPLPVTLQGFPAWAEKPWYLTVGQPPQWCVVGESYVLYNPLNGCTHFLHESAYHIIEQLSRQPMGLTPLMESLGLQEEEASETRDGLIRLLWELDTLGIIAPMQP
ncbi:HPr-rel-A system PqqD family peptide chaperone [Magnetococcus sp. PR-3]|uniref:HPr-rel-A system PqqD family peptide chaperone n=1 Tax=Magnetococcus sp. PR-3 TaxID=3120355 RepID=UPI002FCE078C